MGAIPKRYVGMRMTTSALMVWVGAVGVALGLVMGDASTWLPRDLVMALGGMAVLATVVGLPWLSHRFERSAEVYRPASAGSIRAENLMVVGLVGLMTAALVLLGALLVMIAGKT